MNRTIKCFIAALFILFIIFVVIWLFYPAIERVTINKSYKAPKDVKQEQVYIQSVKLLNKGESIEYKIPSGASIIKIDTNALYFYTPGQRAIPYELQIELFNDKSESVFVKKYFHKGLVRLYKVRGSKRIVSDPFMVDINSYLTKNYEVNIPVESFMKPLILRIRLIEGDKVIIRAAYLNSLSSKSAGKKENTVSGTSAGKFNADAPAKWRNLFPVQDDSKVRRNIRLGVLQPEELIRLKLAPAKKMYEEEPVNARGEILNLYLKSAGGEFKTPTKKNISEAEALFVKLFNDEPVSDAMTASFNALGFAVKEVKTPNNNFIVIHEKEGHREGKGFYIFCRNKKIKRAALEMPHRFFDTMTGIAGYRLMMTGCFSAGAWNTAYRYQTPNLIPGSSDMAHNKRTYFNAFTRAFVKSGTGNILLLQLHGYTSIRHSFNDQNGIQAVLSGGTSEPSADFYKTAKCIKEILENNVLIYPVDSAAENLSARENAAIDYFSDKENPKIFIHFEMDEALREKFISDRPFLKLFARRLSAFLRELPNE